MNPGAQGWFPSMEDPWITPLGGNPQAEFTKRLWEFYAEHRRSFPWREDTSEYSVVVSEFMLQQTQTSRVLPKFQSFMAAFPDFTTLARASTEELLAQWVGLGYNRRARWLQDLARWVVDQGQLPRDRETLLSLKGVGANTCGSIRAFAFNTPEVFIETNVRSVLLHYFYPNRTQVPDKELLDWIAQLVDRNQPRDWYYAVMDLGVYLKKLLPNPSRRSKHHGRQSPFQGSVRQIRGAIVQILSSGPLPAPELTQRLGEQGLDLDGGYEKAIAGLKADSMVAEDGGVYRLS